MITNAPRPYDVKNSYVFRCSVNVHAQHSSTYAHNVSVTAKYKAVTHVTHWQYSFPQSDTTPLCALMDNSVRIRTTVINISSLLKMKYDETLYKGLIDNELVAIYDICP